MKKKSILLQSSIIITALILHSIFFFYQVLKEDVYTEQVTFTLIGIDNPIESAFIKKLNIQNQQETVVRIPGKNSWFDDRGMNRKLVLGLPKESVEKLEYLSIDVGEKNIQVKADKLVSYIENESDTFIVYDITPWVRLPRTDILRIPGVYEVANLNYNRLLLDFVIATLLLVVGLSFLPGIEQRSKRKGWAVLVLSILLLGGKISGIGTAYNLAIFLLLLRLLIGDLYQSNTPSLLERKVPKYLFPLLVLLVLVLFISIKIPLYNQPPLEPHAQKYSTVLDPAIGMVKSGSPFVYQLKYKVDPVNNPEGFRNQFSNLPLVEWALAVLVFLFPGANPILIARLFSTFIGALGLFFAWRFFSRWTGKYTALLIIAFLASTAIYQIASFVIPLDIFTILFMFISLNYVNKYMESGKLNLLIIAALWLGIGTAVKISLFLWYAPILLTLPNINEWKAGRKGIVLRNIYNTGIYGLLPLAIHKTSLAGLPTEASRSLIIFAVEVALVVLVSLIIIRKHETINKFFSWIMERIWALMVLLCLSLLGSIFFLKQFNVLSVAGNFLTDINILFSIKMYAILVEHFVRFASIEFFIVTIAALVYALVFLQHKEKQIVVTFLLGSIVYLVVGAKAIYFHIYYNLIFAVFMALVSGLFLKKISEKHGDNKIKQIGLVLFIVFLLFTLSETAYNTIMVKEDGTDYYRLVEYMKENMAEDEIWIDGQMTFLSSLATLSWEGRSTIDKLNTVQKSINKRNIIEILKELKIKYFVSVDAVFENELLKIVGSSYQDEFNRTDIIKGAASNINQIRNEEFEGKFKADHFGRYKIITIY